MNRQLTESANGQKLNKKMSTSLTTNEMQIKERYSVTSHVSMCQKSACLTASHVDKVVEKQVVTNTAGENVDLYSHSER